MDPRQICILIIASIIFIPFILSLIEEIVKEHINKNKLLKRQNMELKRAYRKIIETERYREYKKINKMQFLSCTIK